MSDSRRITCKTPSAAYPVSLYPNWLASAWTTLIVAPDFSVPDAAQKFSARDPLDAGRAIRPGEVFFTAPLMFRNGQSAAITVSLRIVREGDKIGADFDPLKIINILGPVTVPPYETAQLPIQGRSLLRRDPTKDHGDLLQISCSAASLNGLNGLWLTAQERLSSEHIGVE